VTAVVVSVLAAACGGPGSTSTPRLTLTACQVQGIDARCGRLAVAENPAQPNGRKISLYVAVLPATTTDRASDPLFYFEGGPGGAATDEASWVRSHFQLLNQHRDIVLIDQRGTGRSNAAGCSVPRSTSGTEAETAAAVQSCLDSIKDRADPAFYTTPIAVDDFDQVRAALGNDRVNVYGISYGVSSGLAYVQRHGDHVRAAVFDSGSMLDYHILEQVPRSADQSLKLLFSRCRASSACAAAFPNVEAEFATLVARLRAAPVSVTVKDAATGTDQLVDLDAGTFVSVVISGYLGTTSAAASLPRDLHAAARGDWSAIARATQQMRQGDGFILAMAVTVRCSDEWASHDPAAAAASSPASPFTDYEVQFAASQAAVCKFWPHGTGASGKVTSNAPIVFLNSIGDPVDPPENVATAAAGMPNSVVVAVAGTGHWQLEADTSRCLDDETKVFFESGKRSNAAQWSCAASPPLPAFEL